MTNYFLKDPTKKNFYQDQYSLYGRKDMNKLQASLTPGPTIKRLEK
jgi:hypothetical protein